MWMGVVTTMPGVIEAALSEGVIGRAADQGVFDLELFNVRDHAQDKYGSIDDRPFGGAPGMLMMAEPLAASVDQALARAPDMQTTTIFLSPQGETLTESTVVDLASESALILVCGRYEGVDERFVEQYVDREISIGDYVVSGGELPALILIDAIGRTLDGTLGNDASAVDDSFRDNLLEGPQFTRPRSWRGRAVPDVLTSGNHAAIAQWRRDQALLRTWQRRPDLLTQRRFSDAEKAWIRRHTHKNPQDGV
ncbi:MAG: tRNA (guanosine(37)-N1)-methyltransferase TrmD [Gammaproteobacteria bacterium]|nr:tRNA (guanosine(37)-N1)-methyltransferase TrmD [Gammaproteobacteria bacterium]